MAEGRHTLRLNDAEIKVLDRGLRAYHAIMSIQFGVPDPRREADDIAHVSSLVQIHANCDCGSPKAVSRSEPQKPPVFIEDRKVVRKGDL